ncbi:sugar ABC transporter substrate-binding protein [Campylobacter sp. MIT 99-7217]|uniref:polysaccharide biosynthesis/export family protein n=1 Tax=Campylobacter sp. MIT 99-7217 TaxID=535091 RepID=UPI00115A3C02|nr:polysaccharide biosynthesis/export family protein [Campylobacter sp. MIT 99-7217]TQR34392.1 sugar ABC transporter substrate-binding protein [Campylobacter sp. MIT 99-7217]
MKKILLISIISMLNVLAVDVSQIAGTQAAQASLYDENSSLAQPSTQTNQDPQTQVINQAPKVFGSHLFGGKFIATTQHLYNPDYKIAVGDQISLKIWGAIEFERNLVVDSQGNIFIPQVGAIRVLGVKNSELLSVIKASVSKVYKSNVFVYADMNAYQNVSVFVTGNVNNPGLYQGLSSDSIIQYIDKAGGINLDYGSFRNIQILRDNKLINTIDLYDFLLRGQMYLFPFRSGDVILVSNLKHYALASGEVQKPFRFELKDDIKTLFDLANIAGMKPTTTSAIIRTYGDNHELHIKAVNKKDFANTALNSGDEIEFRPDFNSQSISVKIEGEHGGLHSFVVRKGTSLEEVVKLIKPNSQSDMNSVQVFRKSVARTQKKLIEAQLKELETLALTAPSANSEGAAMRVNQARNILEFIQRAKEVEPKGQIVIENPNAYKSVILEDEDVINIPNKNNLILVQGEVSLPGAFVHAQGKGLKYYINLAGDFSDRADLSKILVIRTSGKAERYSSRFFSSAIQIKPGDSILVLPKVDSQNLQIIGMLTQIVYQIAIATNVVLNINK